MAGVHAEVWWAGLSGADSLADLLDDVESGRRDRYHRDVDRRRFTTAAALLRLVSANRLGVAPESVAVDRRCATCGAPHGRPQLVGTELNVSVSHSGDRVAVAIGRCPPLGVDVELVSEVDPNLVRWVVAPDEKPLPADRRSFFRQWTRKEAVLKATGDGLLTAMSEVALAPPSDPPAVRRHAGDRRPEISLVDLAPGDGYVGALAVMSRQPVIVVERDASALLDRASEVTVARAAPVADRARPARAMARHEPPRSDGSGVSPPPEASFGRRAGGRPTDRPAGPPRTARTGDEPRSPTAPRPAIHGRGCAREGRSPTRRRG
ncbi:MAG: 4'-phosphopantetheinyl transferase superfamily protein [bacterium]|nr:4'-phosphopantetheinyl transferase superfamily protein [bacterium]